MTGKRGFALVLWLACATSGTAGEPAACTDPAHDWLTHPPAELRTIAGRCRSASFTELNYYRACLGDQPDEDAAVAGLITWETVEHRPVMTSHAVHMLLLEQLAALY